MQVTVITQTLPPTQRWCTSSNIRNHRNRESLRLLCDHCSLQLICRKKFPPYWQKSFNSWLYGLAAFSTQSVATPLYLKKQQTIDILCILHIQSYIQSTATKYITRIYNSVLATGFLSTGWSQYLNRRHNTWQFMDWAVMFDRIHQKKWKVSINTGQEINCFQDKSGIQQQPYCYLYASQSTLKVLCWDTWSNRPLMFKGPGQLMVH